MTSIVTANINYYQKHEEGYMLYITEVRIRLGKKSHAFGWDEDGTDNLRLKGRFESFAPSSWQSPLEDSGFTRSTF